MANEIFTQVSDMFVQKALSSIIYILVALIVVGVVSGLMYYFFIYKRKFDIKVKIISSRAGDKDRIIFDNAAILTDSKTKTKYFRIWGLKMDLPSPNFNVMQTAGKFDYLELYRTSEDIIYFLTPVIIDRTRIIKADGKVYGIASQTAKQIDPDLAFWNVKRKGMNKKMFDTEHLLMKILPYIPHIMGGAIMIFILYILLDHLPGILSELSRLVSEMSKFQRAEIVTSTTMLPLFLKWKNN